MGEIKSDDKNGKINFDDPKFWVSKQEFIKILNDEFTSKK